MSRELSSRNNRVPEMRGISLSNQLTNNFPLYLKSISSKNQISVFLSAKDMAYSKESILHRIPYNEIEQLEFTSHYDWRFRSYRMCRLCLASKRKVYLLGSKTDEEEKMNFVQFVELAIIKISMSNSKLIAIRGFSSVRWYSFIIIQLGVLIAALVTASIFPKNIYLASVLLCYFVGMLFVSIWSTALNRPSYINENRPKPFEGIIVDYITKALDERVLIPFRLMRLYMFYPYKLADIVKTEATKNLKEVIASIAVFLGAHFLVLKAIFYLYGVNYNLGEIPTLLIKIETVKPVLGAISVWLIFKYIFGYEKVKLLTYGHLILLSTFISLPFFTIITSAEYIFLLHSIHPVDQWLAKMPEAERGCLGGPTFSCIFEQERTFPIEQKTYAIRNLIVIGILSPLMILSIINQFRIFKSVTGIRYLHIFLAPIISYLSFLLIMFVALQFIYRTW